MKRIPFDTKSHKVARRAAIRAKESGKLAWTRPDDLPRKAKRRAIVALAIGTFLASVAPSYARTAGDHAPRSHAYHVGARGTGSAVTTFRAHMAQLGAR